MTYLEPKINLKSHFTAENLSAKNRLVYLVVQYVGPDITMGLFQSLLCFIVTYWRILCLLITRLYTFIKELIIVPISWVFMNIKLFQSNHPVLPIVVVVTINIVNTAAIITCKVIHLINTIYWKPCT